MRSLLMQSSFRYSLFSLCLMIFIDAMGFGLIIPVLGPLLTDPQHGILTSPISPLLRDTFYGITMSIYTLMMLFGAPLLGDLSDKFGRKKILVSAIFLSSLTYLLSAFGILGHSLSTLIICRGLEGLLASTQPIAQAAIIDISGDENKTKNLGLTGFAAASGFIIGPMISGIFSTRVWVSWFNYSTPFFVASLLAAFNGICILLSYKGTSILNKGAKINLVKGLTRFISGFINKRIRRLTFIYFCIEGSWGIYFQMISLFSHHVYNFTSLRISHLMAYVGFCFAICSTVIIRLSLRMFSEKQIMMIGLLLAMLFTPLFTWFKVSWLLWVCVLPIVFGNSLAYTCGLTFFSQAGDEKTQGQFMGIASSITAASFSIGGLACGTLSSFNISLPFWIAGLLACTGLILTYSLKKKD